MTATACFDRASQNQPAGLTAWAKAWRRRGGRLAAAPLAVALALLTPGSQAKAQVLVTEIAEPVRIEIETGSDVLAYDLCWAEDAESARVDLARRAAAQMTDPAAMHVLALPELPPQWEPLKLGLPQVSAGGTSSSDDDGASSRRRARKKPVIALSSPDLMDAKGRAVDLRAVREGKLQYERHVQHALMDVVERIREARPDAVLTIEGFAGADPDYQELAEVLDFICTDEVVAKRDRQAVRSRSRLASPVKPDQSMLREAGIDVIGRVAFESRGAWYLATIEPLPPTMMAVADETAQRWEENIEREQRRDRSEPDAPPGRGAAERDEGPDVDTHENPADDDQDNGANFIPPGSDADDGDDGADADPADDADDSADDDGGDSRPGVGPGAAPDPSGGGVDNPDGDPGHQDAPDDGDDSGDDGDDGDSDPPADQPDPDAGPTHDGLAMGVNLDYLNYWTRQWAFVDTMKIAMPWVTQNNGWIAGGENPWDSKALEHMNLDENGYPIGLPVEVPGAEAPQIVATLIYRSAGGHYPGGRYICLYDGTGSIEFGMDARKVSETPGRIEVDVNPTDRGVLLKIVESDPSDHVRNVRFIMPGFEDSYEEQIFHPDFLRRLSNFQVIRFLNWQMMNSSDKKNWSDRVSPDHYTQGGPRGVALEYMIELCNRLDADPWLHIPHLAEDDYIRGLARLTRGQLEPGRTLYLEYSNEVWNGNFSQASWAEKHGKALDPTLDDNRARNKFYAKRMAEIFPVFSQVFGRDEDLVRVVGSQHQVPWQAGNIMGYFLEFGGEADAIAVAPYFGGKLGNHANWKDTKRLGVDEILDRCEESIEARLEKTVRNVAVAQEHGMDLIAYEGGQHLVGVGPAGNDAQLTAKFIAANRHPRMYELYMRDMQGWAAAGGGVFCTLSFIAEPSKWGAWGLMEWHTQPLSQAHKWRAVKETAQQWSAGN